MRGDDKANLDYRDRYIPTRRPDGVRKVLNLALRRHGLNQRIARYQFVLHWSEIVGEDIARRTRPECVQGTELVVRVSDSVWAQELSFYKEKILGRLKEYFKDSAPESIRFYVADLKAN